MTTLDGVPVILIDDAGEPGADEADKKRVKTEAGKRFVPVHPELQRIGFLAFAEAMRVKGEKRLFPELKPDALGYLSGPFSKWFNDKRRFIGKLDMGREGRRSSLASGHNYRDALREAEIGLERVVHWADGGETAKAKRPSMGRASRQRRCTERLRRWVCGPGFDPSSHDHHHRAAAKYRGMN